MKVRLITLLGISILMTAAAFPAMSAPTTQSILQHQFLPVVIGGSNKISLRFAMQAHNQDVVCGKSYLLGSADTAVSVRDMRFYISNIRLLKADGSEVVFQLDDDQEWQYQGVGLLDFENGQPLCTGDTRLNSDLIGSAPDGEYTGIRFDLGVPFDLNHGDVALAPAPLNIPGMWWNWQTGYRFVRIDLKTPPVQTGELVLTDWFIHLGSTNCPSGGGAIPPSSPCAHPNRATITLADFNPRTDTIIADLDGLLANIDLGKNTPAPPGCMSGPDDPECLQLFTNFGLDIQTGQCANGCTNQVFFHKQEPLP